MTRGAKLAAPREHLGVLIVPEPATLHASLRASAAEWLAQVRLLGNPVDCWRRKLRSELSLEGPVVATGHQCEFFHAGVFAKIVAAEVLAQAAGGTAVFVSVDCDVLKQTSVAVPQTTACGLRQVQIPVPGCDPTRPVECQATTPREEFVDFFGQLASLHGQHETSLLRPFGEAFLAGQASIHLSEGLARGYAALQANLGLRPARHLLVSRLCATAAFRALAAELILRARQCAQCYNAARSACRVPRAMLPELTIRRELVEVPLWVVQPGGRRRRMLVRPGEQAIELFAEDEPIGSVRSSTLKDPAYAGQAWELERSGFGLRPRAVTLSAFARLFLSDLFIHGLGGARYDRVTDGFVRRFFGVELPPAACVTATVHLPLPLSGVTEADLSAAQRAVRDLRYNPQRYLSQAPPELLARREELIRCSEELRRQQPKARLLRRQVFNQIHQINAQLLSIDPFLPRRLEQHLRELEYQREQDRIAQDRTYFVALHTRSALERLVEAVREKLEAR